MKRKLKTLSSLLMAVLVLLSFAACSESDAKGSATEAPAVTNSVLTTITEALSQEEIFWQDAEYTEDTAIGKGETTFEFQVIVGENSVTFTVSTDKEILGDALMENSLVAGDESQYGLYVKKVNGITADYDVNQYYWSFSKNGEMMMTGVDGEKIEEGAHYEMTCTK